MDQISTGELYPHQRDALNRLKNGKILWGGVGTGKSLVAATYYVEKEAPKEVYVITTAKKRDSVEWEGEFAKYGIGKAADATVAGILTVDSWNNIGKYRHVKGAFFIFDEQRLVGSGDWVDKFLIITKTNNWILLSATPGDTWMDYIPVFVANGFYKNRTEFKRDHVIYNPFTKFPKIDRYVGVGRLVRHRNEILVEMPYLIPRNRIVQTIPVQYDKPLTDKVMVEKWNPYEGRPLKNVSEFFRVLRRITAGDSTRLTAVRTLMKSHPKLIVFYNFDFELEMLRQLTDSASVTEFEEMTWKINSVEQISNTSETISNECLEPSMIGNGRSLKTSSPTFGIAEYNGHKHEPIPQTDRWVYLVQYAAGSEGWNCVSTNAMIFYSLPYSYKQFSQAMGRIDRINSPFLDLYYYVLDSGSLIDKAIANCLALKKTFNESAQKWIKIDKYVERSDENG